MPEKAPDKAAAKRVKIAYQDIERKVVKDDKETLEVIDAKTQERIVRQVNEEYELAFKFNEGKRIINLARLKLYNNQRRVPEAVGDPLMFTVFNTIHAALYDDRLMQTWEGREEGDDEVEENLNALSNYDYDLMGKSELDYYWNWDAEFFGRGLMWMMEFDRERMCPVPELIDAVTFIRDPKAKSFNGYGLRGEGALRFGGWPSGATYWELKNHPAFFNINLLRKDKEVGKSLLDEAREARNEAQNRDAFYPQEEALGKYNNYEFQLMNWITHIKGEKFLVSLGNRRTQLCRMTSLDKFDGRWPGEDRALYPMANDWDGVSIPDLTEDKQRARALLLNLGLKSAKSDAMPQYLYDRTRIKNKNDLNWRHDKFIGVDGRVDNAIQPMQKSTVHQYVNLIMDILDTASQRATATPEIQQGIASDDRRTLGELNLVSAKVDTRYSMSAKVYALSDQRFWNLYYKLYKRFFKEKIDKKVVRIQGALAAEWRPLTRDNIVSTVDPDVRIESKVISEAKRIRDQQAFSVFASLALQTPDSNRRYVLRHLAKLNGLTKEQIDATFPKTIDEMKAEDENTRLNDNKQVDVDVNENHMEHIAIHAKAADTPARLVHIKAHRQAALIRRTRPELFPQDQVAAQGQQAVQPVPDRAPLPRPQGVPAR